MFTKDMGLPGLCSCIRASAFGFDAPIALGWHCGHQTQKQEEQSGITTLLCTEATRRKKTQMERCGAVGSMSQALRQGSAAAGRNGSQAPPTLHAYRSHRPLLNQGMHTLAKCVYRGCSHAEPLETQSCELQAAVCQAQLALPLAARAFLNGMIPGRWDALVRDRARP